jgi:hypothetical protein
MKKLLFLKIFILVFSGLKGQQQSPEYIIFKKDVGFPKNWTVQN